MRSLPIRGRHTTAQVGRILGMEPREVRAEIYSGPLVAERDGRRLYVWTDSLALYVRGMR